MMQTGHLVGKNCIRSLSSAEAYADTQAVLSALTVIVGCRITYNLYDNFTMLFCAFCAQQLQVK